MNVFHSVISKRGDKKTSISWLFEYNVKVNINVLKIVAFYEPCVDQLSYVQLYEHHE